MEYSKRLDLLRSILERMKNKEEIDPNELTEAGLKKTSRIKDIEKEIKTVRSKVSATIKKKVQQEEEADLEEMAAERQMTVEKLKEEMAETAHNERKKELLRNAKVEGDLLKAVAKERKKKNDALQEEVEFE